MDSILLAHVADVLTYISDVDSDYSADVDYDAIADDAATLLRRVPSLADTVEQWDVGKITWDDLVAAVRSALAADSTRCTVYTYENGHGHETDVGTDPVKAWALADAMRADGHTSATVLEYAGGAR